MSDKNWKSNSYTFTVVGYDENGDIDEETAKVINTISSFEPMLSDNVEIIDSLSQHRLGYHYPGNRRIKLSFTLKHASYKRGNEVSDVQSDHDILFKYILGAISDNGVAGGNDGTASGSCYKGMFDLRIEGRYDNVVLIFRECTPTKDSLNLDISAMPDSKWEFHALDVNMTNKATNKSGSYFKEI